MKNEASTHKKQWTAPKLKKISVKDTNSGPFIPNVEAGACRPS